MNPSSPPEDRFAGRFAEWTPLAGGAEGRLFRVRDRWTGRVVALKTGEGEVGRASVLHEYALLSRLRHPCLLTSLGLLWDGDSPAHLLEYVPAVPPETLWSEGGEAAVRAAIVQAHRGLAYLHRRGWVHADVAPGNVLVWREGERWRAKVADLGLCLPVADAARLRDLRGTLDTMSPEGARGKGLTPLSDLYSLAATAVTWIDGLAMDAEVEAATVLRERAAATGAVAADRPVSASLARCLGELGAAEAGARSAEAVCALRTDPAAFGPDVLEGGLHGVEATAIRWGDELRGQPGAVVTGLLLGGRVGSGRHTLLQTRARGLVMQGWAELRGLPLDTLRDWLDAGGETDPVRLARAMVDRYRGRNVVVLWPHGLTEVGFRLLQAFLIARGEVGGWTRTVVLAVRGGSEAQEAWLTSTVRVTTREWEGPGDAAVRALAEDLWAEDDGETPPVEGWTPLAVLALRRRGTSEGDEGGVDSVEAEVREVWSEAAPDLRAALAFLAWNGDAWPRRSLVTLFGESTVARLEEHPLARTSFGGERRRIDLADWLVREALTRFTDDANLRGDLVARLLEHPADAPPPVVLALARAGEPVEALLGGAARRALDEAAYETVVDLFRASPQFPAEGWPAVLDASRRIGRLPEEAEVLRRMVGEGGREVQQRRRELVRPLTALGAWEEALAVCREIVGSSPEGTEDRLWSRFQEAELLWQWGRLGDSDQQFDALEEAVRGVPALFAKLAISRARSFGQRGEIETSSVWLDKGVEVAGAEAMESLPQYWNTRAAVALENRRISEVLQLIEEATIVAERSSDWQSLIMANTRIASALIDQGVRYQEAEARARSAMTTATAFGSERMAAMCGCYLGLALSYLGEADVAFSLAESAMQVSSGKDSLLEEHAARVFLVIGSFYAQDDWLERGMQFDWAGRETFKGTRLMARSIGLLVAGSAAAALESVVEARELWDQMSSQNRSWDAVAIESEVLALLGRWSDFSVVGQILDGLPVRSRYTPVYDVVRRVRDCDQQGLVEAFKEIEREGQVFLGAYLALHALSITTGSYRVEVARIGLANIRTIAESFASEERRRRFLAAPRYGEVLKQLSG